MVIITTTFIILVFRIHCTYSYNTPSKSIRNLAYLAIICFIISMTTGVSTIFISYSNINWTYTKYAICNIFIVISWNCAQILIYISLLHRIFDTFRATKYELSQFNLICFAILICLYILCCISWIISTILNISHDKKHVFDTNDDIFNFEGFGIGDFYALGIEILDLLICIFLITMFIKKMVSLTVDLNDNVFGSGSICNDDHHETSLNDHQRKLLNIMTKYFILSLIATISTQIECLLLCINWFFNLYFDDGMMIQITSWIIEIVFPLDCMINSLCIFLLFDINKDLYNKWCKLCHFCCLEFCFKKNTEKKIKKTIGSMKLLLTDQISDATGRELSFIDSRSFGTVTV